MTAKNSLAAALKTVRKARGLSQEAFSDVSSRTYLSSLERNLKSPTLNKLAELCEVMEIHPRIDSSYLLPIMICCLM